MKLRNFAIPLIVSIALLTWAKSVNAQRPGTSRPTTTEVRRVINNETLRDLINADAENPKVPVNDPASYRAAVLKQVQNDFRALQAANNKMMAEAWAQNRLDFDHISELISEINARAVRLKNNLSLPQVDQASVKDQRIAVSSVKEFRSELLTMDRSIMHFVTNPIFQNTGVIEISSATQAAQDLGQVILLSSDLKKTATRLKP